MRKKKNKYAKCTYIKPFVNNNRRKKKKTLYIGISQKCQIFFFLLRQKRICFIKDRRVPRQTIPKDRTNKCSYVKTMILPNSYPSHK